MLFEFLSFKEVFKIKALILAAGYATRLYPLTKDKPKHLIEVGNKTILERVLRKIEKSSRIDEVFIVTNNKFHGVFENYLNNFECSKKITLVNDNTFSNDDRLGAVGDINHVIEKHKINSDLMVIAGDNLFGFEIDNFVNFFLEKKSNVVAFSNLGSFNAVRGKFGVGILENDRIVAFEEKPQNPRSTLASTACYVFNKESIGDIQELNGKGVDNLGLLIGHLMDKNSVHGFVFEEHWFDIGSFESLEDAREEYRL